MRLSHFVARDFSASYPGEVGITTGDVSINQGARATIEAPPVSVFEFSGVSTGTLPRLVTSMLASLPNFTVPLPLPF